MNGAMLPLTKKERDKLRRRLCSFCDGRLTLPAAGLCAGIYSNGSPCGWVMAFRTLGIDEALRQSKRPHDQRSAVA